jgi:hypothetical protein
MLIPSICIEDQKIAAFGNSYRGMRLMQELPQAAIFAAFVTTYP